MTQWPMLVPFRNKKKGDLYYVVEETINTTNDRDGTVMFKYIREEWIHGIPLGERAYCRQRDEFMEKFELVAMQRGCIAGGHAASAAPGWG